MDECHNNETNSFKECIVNMKVHSQCREPYSTFNVVHQEERDAP